MKKAESLREGVVIDLEAHDPNYQTGGCAEKARNNVADADTVNSFQNIEIQRNLSQKSKDKAVTPPP